MRAEALRVDHLCHRYGARIALNDITFTVAAGEIFGLLGPNGGGKTTLFKILSTLLRPTAGNAMVFGDSVADAAPAVRRHLGVVFQHPSLDGTLTVWENLRCHGMLYGLSGALLQNRACEVLESVGLTERRADQVDTLSGGLQRRTELAKALLHQPDLLLLDEPSTGLDPGARRDFLRALRQRRDQAGVTIVFTTHYLEEAEYCDRVAFLHLGRLVRAGSPADLKDELGGDVVVLHSPDPVALQSKLRERFDCDAVLVNQSLRIVRARGHEFLRDVVDAFPSEILSAATGKPTLEDVFVRWTGQHFWETADAASPGSR